MQQFQAILRDRLIVLRVGCMRTVTLRRHHKTVAKERVDTHDTSEILHRTLKLRCSHPEKHAAFKRRISGSSANGSVCNSLHDKDVFFSQQVMVEVDRVCLRTRIFISGSRIHCARDLRLCLSLPLPRFSESARQGMKHACGCAPRSEVSKRKLS